MPRYKRNADEAQLDLPVVEPEVPLESQEMLMKLRNMWEFASLMQYIFLFGNVVKIDENFDIEELEAECLKPSPSEKLARIGLQLLKYVSSHRGLTPEIFDEYTRRQYLAKAPQRNPFGDDEEPLNFNDLDIYTRIKTLQQLSTWTLGNADRIRNMMPEDEDHLNWRMEPLGWDREDRSYYVLDDNRLYRRSDEPVPPPSPKPKAKSKANAKSKVLRSSESRATRVSKRRRIEDSDDDIQEEQPEVEIDNAEDTIMTNGDHPSQEEEAGYGFTSTTWECIAITLEEYQDFTASIFRSRDPNEKALRARIEEDVLPIIEKRAEALQQKQQKKLRDLENLQKMATAKRSSRLADKAEKEKLDREEKEAEEKRQVDLQMAREEQQRQRRIEEGHESRRLTREQRVREREAKRILHEEELARLEEEGDRAVSQEIDGDAGDAKRASERQRKTQREQHKKELEKLAEDEGNWYFDCSICGKHGENMDDGTHSIACDRCSVWQHSKCHGFSPKQAEHKDFTFVCGTCKRKEEEAKKPKIPPLKLINRSSESPEAQKVSSRPATANDQSNNDLPEHITRQLDSLPSSQISRPSPGPFGQILNGPSLSPHSQVSQGYRYPPISNFAPQPQQAWQGSSLPPPSRVPGPYAGSPPGTNGHHQQHHYTHQNAVASAGGHYYPQQYAPPPPPQTNGYSPRAPAGMYPTAQPYNQNQHQQLHHQPQQPYAQYHPQYSPQNRTQQSSPRLGSGHAVNGHQSPEKATRKPLPISPSAQHQQRLTPQGVPPHPQNVQQSPHTHLPPPSQTYPRGAQSPVKSSPPPLQQLSPLNQLPSPHPPRPSNPSPMSNGPHDSQTSDQSKQFQTPQMQRPGSAGREPHATTVAADGMSGPWPEGSQAIPQKHDQSPAPPSSAHSIAEKKIFPPNTPLVPSPNQQSTPTGAESIPAKKMPELSPRPDPLTPRPLSYPEKEAPKPFPQ